MIHAVLLEALKGEKGDNGCGKNKEYATFTFLILPRQELPYVDLRGVA
jgi:hypothetical protein